METEYQKQRRGEWFDATCEELSVFYVRVQRLLKEYNATDVLEQEKRRSLLKEITGFIGKNVTVTPPLYCDYGRHLFLEDNVYINTGSVFLDAGYVRIGQGSFIGPNVQFYTVNHPLDAERRRKGLEKLRRLQSEKTFGSAGRLLFYPA